jgi:hypothetical protein
MFFQDLVNSKYCVDAEKVFYAPLLMVPFEVAKYKLARRRQYFLAA